MSDLHNIKKESCEVDFDGINKFVEKAEQNVQKFFDTDPKLMSEILPDKLKPKFAYELMKQGEDLGKQRKYE